MAKTGITSVTDAGTGARSLQSYQDAHEHNELKTRIYCMIRGYAIDEIIQTGKKTGDGDKWVKIGGMKLACDGSISERTARLSQPYVGRPNDYGIIVNNEEQLYNQAIKAHNKDWQIGIHANGDIGIDIALNVYERLQKENYRKDPRFRLEHCTVINDNLIKRIKALNAIPTPFSTYVYWHGEKMKEYGKDRLENMFAVKSFLDAGINVTQTSDYPPGPFEPMMAIQSSVTRTDYNGEIWGPSQKISVEEAIKVGADAVSYHINVLSAHEGNQIEALAKITKDANEFGMPVLVMCYVRGHEEDMKDPRKISHAVRLGEELGGDIIKTVYTGDSKSFESVVTATSKPVVIAGGKKGTDKETIEMVKGAMDAGAAGVSMGRCIFQHKDPESISRAVVEIVHNGASVEKAMEKSGLLEK